MKALPRPPLPAEESEPQTQPHPQDATSPLSLVGSQTEASALRAPSRLVATEERQSDYSTAQIVVLAAVFAAIYVAARRVSEAHWRRRCRQLIEFLRKQALPGCCDLFLYVRTRGKALQKLARSRSASWAGSNSVSDIFSRAKGRAKDDLPTIELSRKPRREFAPLLLVPESPAGNVGSSSRFRSILSDENVAGLLGSLPRRYAIKNWQLVYASELHGYSLYTAYRKFAARRADSSSTPGFFIAVMDANQHVFGAFSTEVLRVNSTYFGTGESFLAKLHPEFATFPWTGKNSQFVLAKEDMLAFGGGGKFALWLDSSFEKGTSDPGKLLTTRILCRCFTSFMYYLYTYKCIFKIYCAGSPTFDNPCIASVEHFKCISVEIWGFTNASKLPKLKGFIGKSGV